MGVEMHPPASNARLNQRTTLIIPLSAIHPPDTTNFKTAARLVLPATMGWGAKAKRCLAEMFSESTQELTIEAREGPGPVCHLYFICIIRVIRG
jgi:hypothetical protein